MDDVVLEQDTPDRIRLDGVGRDRNEVGVVDVITTDRVKHADSEKKIEVSVLLRVDDPDALDPAVDRVDDFKACGVVPARMGIVEREILDPRVCQSATNA